MPNHLTSQRTPRKSSPLETFSERSQPARIHPFTVRSILQPIEVCVPSVSFPLSISQFNVVKMKPLFINLPLIDIIKNMFSRHPFEPDPEGGFLLEAVFFIGLGQIRFDSPTIAFFISDFFACSFVQSE
jgi:hypothetical protein